MTELLETKDKKSAFQVFLESEKLDMRLMMGENEITKTRKSTLSEYINNRNEYKELIEDRNNLELFNKMRLLETKMVQARCLIDTKVKLSMINQKRGGSETSYIIARAPFYNPDNVKAEIRVYLGKTEDIGRSVEELSRDIKFMDNAEQQIVSAMKEVMEKIEIPVKTSIKKSISVREVALTDYENEVYEKEKKQMKRIDPRKAVFQPGQGTNPKPKHYGVLPPKKK